MRNRFAIKSSVPRIRLSLRIILRMFIVSLSITASLLSVTLFLLHGSSKPWHNSRDNRHDKEDGFLCKLSESNLSSHDESAVLNLTSKSLIIVRSVFLFQYQKLFSKILFLKRCETNVDDLRLQIDMEKVICPSIKHIESDLCPWNWAPGCLWSSFIATARLDFIPDNIFLNFNSHTIPLKLEPSHDIENLSFAVCIQPLYWYVDWLKIIEFIEIWSFQGVNHFFVYFYTVSKLVMDILQYYEAKGTVTLLPWRSFPVGKDENPNNNVYRLAHSLSNNDCLWRSQGANFVAFVDLDEYILTTNGVPLVKFIQQKAALCPQCGSFTVVHRKMYYSSPRPQNDFHWRNINFEWLTNVSYGLPEMNGPHKQIVRPETVSIISTHSTRESYTGYINVNLNSSEIILLHASLKWSETNYNSVNKVTTLTQKYFANAVLSLSSAYEEIGQLLFKNETMQNIDWILQMEVSKCIKRWHINKCKSIDICKANLIVNQRRWIYAENLTNHKYYFV